MNRILVTGAAGQLGSELIPALRERYGNNNVVAARHRSPLTEEVADSGPSTRVDVSEQPSVESAIRDFGIDSLYHLGSLLSVAAEANRPLAHRVNIVGLLNVLEAAVNTGLERVIIPSSIAAFGNDTPHDNTPNETLQRPTSLYGISKVFGELMGNYFSSGSALTCAAFACLVLSVGRWSRAAARRTMPLTPSMAPSAMGGIPAI